MYSGAVALWSGARRFGNDFLSTPVNKPWPLVLLLASLELLLCSVIIQRVSYTEIDWRAYMQQVETVLLTGERNYSRISGSTGPLVYPAGHVYLYSALWWFTDRGVRLCVAQYVLAAVHVGTVALACRVYSRCARVPPYVLLLLCLTAYRVHSIAVLRLFNDPLAMLLLYAAVNCWLDSHWLAGSVLYSLAVSVKMNVLLFSPALLLVFVRRLGWRNALLQLSVCASVQLLVGAPFLSHAPLDYIAGAFNLGRVFEYKWTVNWRVLPPHVFLSRHWHALLLLLHVVSLAVLTTGRWWQQLVMRSSSDCSSCTSCRMVVPLFTCNLVGVAFSRSLHYQFYVWYYHSWPLLLWSSRLPTWLRLVLWAALEYCWNQYPSTVLSSLLLHCCHLVLLVSLWMAGSSAVVCSLCRCNPVNATKPKQN